MPIGDLAPEIAVLIAAVAAILWASFATRHLQAGGAAIAIAGLALAAALLVRQVGQVQFTFSGTWTLDGAGLWMRLMIVAATALSILMAPAWFTTDRRHGEIYPILLLSALGAMGMAGAGDLLQLMISVLLSSVTGYTLAAWHRDWALSVEAGIKYFLLGALANALLVTGIVLVIGMLGTTGYGDLTARIAEGSPTPLLIAGFALILVGLCFKLGAVPGHAWVPDVAEGAPGPVAAFLTIVPKLAAALALARLMALAPVDMPGVRPLVAVLSAATMTLGNLAALWQQDLRRLLGWSSVAQAGYALMAVAVIGQSGDAVMALLAFLLSYTVGNLAAFAVVVHLRGRTDIADYAGLARQQPAAAVVLVLALLSLTGIPPLIGFVGKFTLFMTVIDGNFMWLALAAAANTVASLFYYARVMATIYFDPPGNPVETLGRGSAVAMWMAGIATILATLLAGPLLSAFGSAALLP